MSDEGSDWDLPEDWTVWNDAEGKVVLAYRPDVFDGGDYPAPCLPTIYVTQGRRNRRPGTARGRPGEDWYVTLYLEPEVERDPERFDSEAAAREGAADLATRFAAGEIAYRELYQVPRPDYFDRLDELTGRDA